MHLIWGGLLKVKTVEEYLDQAYRAYQDDMLEESLALYDEAINAGGDKANINYYKGIVCEDKYKYDLAIEYYMESIEYKDEFIDPLVRVYEIYSQLNRNDEAIETIDRMIEISPDLYFIYDLKFKFLFNLRKLEEADSLLKTIEEKFDNSDEIILNKVKLNTIIGNFPLVVEVASSISEDSPIYFECLKEKAKVLAFQGDIISSIELLKVVNSNMPSDVETMYLIGTFDLLLGEVEDARNYLKGLTELKYSEDLCYFLGMYYYGATLKLFKEEDTDKYFKKLLVKYVEYNTNNPNNLSLMVLRGICLYETKQYDKCLHLMDQALKLCESFAEAHYVKSLVYRELNDVENETREQELVTTSEPMLGMLLVVLEGMNEYIVDSVSE